MKALSSNEWARRGYRIITGERSFLRGAGGVALFTGNQVTPWERRPGRAVIYIGGDRYVRG